MLASYAVNAVLYWSATDGLQLAALIRRRRLALLVDPMNERLADIYREFGFKSVEGSDHLVLNFRE